MFDENGKCGYGQDYPDASHAKRDDGKNRVPPHVLKQVKPGFTNYQPHTSSLWPEV